VSSAPREARAAVVAPLVSPREPVEPGALLVVRETEAQVEALASLVSRRALAV